MSANTALKLARELMYNPSGYNWERFYYMNAYISECILNRFFLVKFYNTIVGLIDDQQGEFFEFGKYSRTTSKQCTIIARKYECKKIYVNERL